MHGHTGSRMDRTRFLRPAAFSSQSRSCGPADAAPRIAGACGGRRLRGREVGMTTNTRTALLRTLPRTPDRGRLKASHTRRRPEPRNKRPQPSLKQTPPDQQGLRLEGSRYMGTKCFLFHWYNQSVSSFVPGNRCLPVLKQHTYRAHGSVFARS